jgi:hypothetical protein
MSASPKSLVKSRENLQAISNNPHIIIKKYEIFDRVLSRIWGNISMTRKSPHIINLHDTTYYSGSERFVFTEAIRLELIEILKREYPGVDFTYKETSGYDGKILEKIIIMDWS